MQSNHMDYCGGFEIENFAAQNKALAEIYRELLSLKTEMKKL